MKSARFNFRINGVKAEPVMTGDLRELKIPGKFDFVAANILTAELVGMKRKIVSLVSPGGYLAVSGISLENYRWFRGKFDGGCIRCVEARSGKEWAGVLYRKRA